MHHVTASSVLCAALCALPRLRSRSRPAAPRSATPRDPADGAARKDAILLGQDDARARHARGAAGQTVVVERREAGGDWQPATTAIAANDGSFDATWTTDHIGHFRCARACGARPTAAPPPRPPPCRRATITVFRSTLATWFGPGFYGRRTACGQRMTHRLLGVRAPDAALRHEGRAALQGPHDHRAGRRSRPVRHGASYDLTSATAEALGMTQTSRIGAVRAG